MESKLYKWNKRGSRMIVDSGYKTFDNYIVAISHGNCVGGGQYSLYIRPFNETECYENTKEKGYYRNYDLSMFNRLNSNVKNYVESITENKGCILYEFYTMKNGEYNRIGYIVEQEGNYKIFNNNYYAWGKKQKCLEFIVEVLKEKEY